MCLCSGFVFPWSSVVASDSQSPGQTQRFRARENALCRGVIFRASISGCSVVCLACCWVMRVVVLGRLSGQTQRFRETCSVASLQSRFVLFRHVTYRLFTDRGNDELRGRESPEGRQSQVARWRAFNLVSSCCVSSRRHVSSLHGSRQRRVARVPRGASISGCSVASLQPRSVLFRHDVTYRLSTDRDNDELRESPEGRQSQVARWRVFNLVPSCFVTTSRIASSWIATTTSCASPQRGVNLRLLGGEPSTSFRPVSS
jgi:hypothetical protein